MRRMLLVKAMRPDRVVFAAKTFVKDLLSEEFVDPPACNMKDI